MAEFTTKKVITFDDFDSPWMDVHMKNIILAKDFFFKKKNLFRKKDDMLCALCFQNFAKRFSCIYSDCELNNHNKIKVGLSPSLKIVLFTSMKAL